MISFDCKKCIHFPVCKFKNEAADKVNVYNERIGENETFILNLNCKYYGSITVNPVLRG